MGTTKPAPLRLLKDPSDGGDFALSRVYSGSLSCVHVGTARSKHPSRIDHALPTTSLAKEYCESLRDTQGRVFYVLELPCIVLCGSDGEYLASIERFHGLALSASRIEDVSTLSGARLTASNVLAALLSASKHPHWISAYHGSGPLPPKVENGQQAKSFASTAIGQDYKLLWIDKRATSDIDLGIRNNVGIARVLNGRISTADAAATDERTSAQDADLHEVRLASNVVSLSAFRASRVASRDHQNEAFGSGEDEAAGNAESDEVLLAPLHGAMTFYLWLRKSGEKKSIADELRPKLMAALSQVPQPASICVSNAAAAALDTWDYLGAVKAMNAAFCDEVDG